MELSLSECSEIIFNRYKELKQELDESEGQDRMEILGTMDGIKFVVDLLAKTNINL